MFLEFVIENIFILQEEPCIIISVFTHDTRHLASRESSRFKHFVLLVVVTLLFPEVEEHLSNRGLDLELRIMSLLLNLYKLFLHLSIKNRFL